ncbi:hypothetical protein [Saccharothrix australiensis]|uniref:Peptidase inhibitor family I36 n=1 Tax=Saccharothrix australiensis TaxID=2072 RepID=A0A495VYG8_9PSEU|nr:hypothetical protein [Saccharothrix australiensis]RKT53633.1 hypothetical protein C8E97_2205 [Saccharothrix australiensis]
MFLSAVKRIGVVLAAVAGAAVLAASPASAAQQCGDLRGPEGGTLPLCKSWNWDGNDYDGKWWTNGPSSLPSHTYLQRSEDGSVTNSSFSGSYQDVKTIRFRLCDSSTRRCTGWW